MEKDEWVVCEACGAKLKKANLQKHYSNLHPSKKVQTTEKVEAERRWTAQILLPVLGASVVVILIAMISALGPLSRGALPNTETLILIVIFALVFGFGLFSSKR